MHLKLIGIHKLFVTAERVEIKSTFGFLDEVFHLAAAAIEPRDLTRIHFHRGNDKSIHVKVWFASFSILKTTRLGDDQEPA